MPKKLRHVANVFEDAVPEWIDGDIAVEDDVHTDELNRLGS